MSPVPRSSLLAFLSAVLGVVAAVLLRAFFLVDWLGNDVSVLVLFLPVIGAAVFGGWKPGLFATALGGLAAAFFFYAPYDSWEVHDPAEQVELILFLSLGVAASFLVSSLRSEAMARRRAEELARNLAEADRHKDQFLATLAHELRNPLATFSNALYLLQRGNDKAVPMMERQVQQMRRLVDDLTDLSRIANGKLRLQKERIEMTAAVQRAAETAQPLIEEAGHELTVTMPREPIHLEADLTRLTQVFLNLLTNASRYTERGGRISLTAEGERDWVLVKVRDNGIGISAEILPHIFELFTQSASALKKSRAGLGIGLALVRQLVEMHGGSIQAHSAGADQGSEFTVRLPILKPVPRQKEELADGYY